jgi:hypothetical protein
VSLSGRGRIVIQVLECAAIRDETRISCGGKSAETCNFSSRFPQGCNHNLQSRSAITACNCWTKVQARDKIFAGFDFDDYALTTLPLRRQEVQTRMCLLAAPTLA